MASSSVTIRYSPDGGECGEQFAVCARAQTSDQFTLEALEHVASKAFYKTVASAIALYTERDAKSTTTTEASDG